MRYVVTIHLGAGAVASVALARQYVTLVKTVDAFVSTGPGPPAAAAVDAADPAGLADPPGAEGALVWLALPPAGRLEIAWEARYHLYATPSALRVGRDVAPSSWTENAAAAGLLYPYDRNNLFRAPGPDGYAGHYGVTNQSGRNRLGFGLAQHASINGAAPAGPPPPVGVAAVLNGQQALFYPAETVSVFLQSHSRRGTLIPGVPGGACAVTLTDAQPSAALAFDPATNLFYLRPPPRLIADGTSRGPGGRARARQDGLRPRRPRRPNGTGYDPDGRASQTERATTPTAAQAKRNGLRPRRPREPNGTGDGPDGYARGAWPFDPSFQQTTTPRHPTMKTFAQIIAALGAPAGGPWTIGDNPPLTVSYNQGTQTLVAALNAGVHITIYQSSWDGKATIADCTGRNVTVGPHCLHTTAGADRWFRQYDQVAWGWVTDCGTPTERYLLAFDSMMSTLGPYLGVNRRAARRPPRPRAAPAPGGQVNRIVVGPITSTNPTLWVNMLSLGQSQTDYMIATGSPGDNYVYVNQFCSVLSIKWLAGGRNTNPYGIGNFSDSEKRSMAETLIGYASMDDQIAYAEAQLGGAQRSLDEVARGVEQGAYPVGTKIWAGNDFHVVAIVVSGDSEYSLYDSNTGLVTKLPRAGFRRAMEQLRYDAFVVTAP